jgi:anaerobic ribonucleoside-triphosphate reductase activating protein
MTASTHSGESVETIRVFRRESPIKVLGPHDRAAIWVQGCTFQCPGCIVPESWDPAGGWSVRIEDLAAWVLLQPGIEGVTLSGGEPMSQAAGLTRLVDRIRESRDLGVMCYTGFALGFLRERGDSAQRGLLDRIDLLIDGVYLEEQHDDLLWRGSRNQKLNLLTRRYEKTVSDVLRDHGDRSAGVEVVFDEQGAIGIAGVPSKPRFREAFVERMRAHNIRLSR